MGIWTARASVYPHILISKYLRNFGTETARPVTHYRRGKSMNQKIAELENRLNAVIGASIEDYDSFSASQLAELSREELRIESALLALGWHPDDIPQDQL